MVDRLGNLFVSDILRRKQRHPPHLRAFLAIPDGYFAAVCFLSVGLWFTSVEPRRSSASSLGWMTVNDLMDQLAPIGRDPATGGYRRFAWTEPDMDLRRWFSDQAVARGLRVEKDRNANLWAYLGDSSKGGLVAVGSHFDSVADGGAFDGPLGIASAFAALDLLKERGLRPDRTVAVVLFHEEEGARFGVPCLGSRLLTGAIDPDRARSLTDADGNTLAHAMTAAGEHPDRLGPDLDRARRVSSFVELHIEQGRALVDLGQPVAIGSEIWPHGRWRLDIQGVANHAGTTLMEDRDDPTERFAATLLRVLETARNTDTRATFGRLQVTPNSTNAIPSRVTAWLDARAADQANLDGLLESIGGDAVVTAESISERVAFDSDLRNRLQDVLGQVPVLATAAGHDAGVLSAAGIATAMLFVRNPTGVSHSPAESATRQDCVAGTEALAMVLTDLAAFH
jgi:N-carbamoyl-L-amino-acid hydrolase